MFKKFITTPNYGLKLAYFAGVGGTELSNVEV